MTGYKIPHFGLKRQYNNLREELLVATDQVLQSGSWVNGQYTDEFVGWLKSKTRTWYAVPTHSGTQALEIMALFEKSHYLPELQPTVYIPNITYPATVNAFINAGWDIELKDTDSNGIIKYEDDDHRGYQCVVGLYGAAPQTNFVDPISYNKSHVFVDGAQHWLVGDGNVGEGMAISFDPTKNLPSSGNGGAIVTNNKFMYEFALDYTDNGKYKSHTFSGSNSKLSEVDCAHLLVRSKYIDEWQKRRKEIRLYWLEQFKELPFRCLSRGFEKHADQKFVIYSSDSRDKLLNYLLIEGIEAKVHYPRPLSDLPVTQKYKSPDMLSTSVMLCGGLLSLPIYPELTDTEVEFISEKIKKFFDK